jgi:hypothetical protein
MIITKKERNGNNQTKKVREVLLGKFLKGKNMKQFPTLSLNIENNISKILNK